MKTRANIMMLLVPVVLGDADECTSMEKTNHFGLMIPLSPHLAYKPCLGLTCPSAANLWVCKLC